MLKYITSAFGLGGGVQKSALFADVQYSIYANIVGGSKKAQKCADVTYEWFLKVS